MLLSTFQHLKGIGKKTERDLWRSGAVSWDDWEHKQQPSFRCLLALTMNFQTAPFIYLEKLFRRRMLSFLPKDYLLLNTIGLPLAFLTKQFFWI
jgi:hypothetical protein